MITMIKSAATLAKRTSSERLVMRWLRPSWGGSLQPRMGTDERGLEGTDAAGRLHPECEIPELVLIDHRPPKQVISPFQPPCARDAMR